jgi:hypothetical protein
MPNDEFDQYLAQFRQLIGECQDLYRSSGELAASQQESLGGEPGRRFIDFMDDLHRALLVKVFVNIAQCDHQWSANERALADALVQHLWGKQLDEQQLRAAILDMADKATAIKWYSLVRPFDQMAVLRNRVGELETIVTRLAHVIGRVDGELKEVEAASIKSIQDELQRHLRPIPIDDPAEHAEAERIAPEAVKKIIKTAASLPQAPPAATGTRKAAAPVPTVAEVLTELDQLIGLEAVKAEVRTLANFLKVQSHRKEVGLPTTGLSLHMVFNGNPGTGKTSVARIVGKIFGAMGVLAKGHLVETDRSGLVAEYAGQTGPKSHKKIDESLDGVLFIDEAYSLCSADKDPYGEVAVQTLLKRMEDDRHRLVVILAGYPEPMEELLDSNPGLSSRFSRRLEFADYTPLELAAIFGQMCDKNHYRLGAAARARAMAGFTWLYDQRDEHFGNGRTVRNLFEHAIRRQANRIAGISKLSMEELTTLEPADVHFADCPEEVFARLNDGATRFHISCAHCHHDKDVPQAFLGQTVRCPKCKQEFFASWGALSPSLEGGPAASSLRV